MNPKIKALKAAFPYTIPILMGFLFLGLAYGFYMNSKGFSFWWPLLMSATIFAGSMEFVTVSLLCGAFNPVYVLFTGPDGQRQTFVLWDLHAGALQGRRQEKWYLIFGMCDESFSILCSTKPPKGVDKGWFMVFVTLLNQCYWVAGATLGGILGSFIPFNTQGIDFVMTALFAAIFIDQWKSQKNHLPALVGLAVPAVCLIIFGPDQFILPSMALILTVLSLLKKPLNKETVL